MSIHHIEAAAELELPATKKLAFMAICDDASKDTRVAYPGLQKVMTWTGVQKRTALGLIESLVAEGLIYRLGGGYSGRRAEYLVFPSPEEIESLDAFLKAVDNSRSEGQNKGARLSTHQILKGAEKWRKGADTSTPPVKPPVVTDLEQSIPEATTESLVDNSGDDDGVESPQLTFKGRRLHRRATRGLDVDQLEVEVGHVFSDFANPRYVLHLIALRILAVPAAAGTAVTAPTEYVAKSIKLEPEVHRKRAFAIEGTS